MRFRYIFLLNIVLLVNLLSVEKNMMAKPANIGMLYPILELVLIKIVVNKIKYNGGKKI
jgi:hypothetical protein